VLRTRRPPRAPTATSSAAVLRRLLRCQAPEETSHRAPDLGLHQLTNDRDETLLSRHPPPPCSRELACPIQDWAGWQMPSPSIQRSGGCLDCEGLRPTCAE